MADIQIYGTLASGIDSGKLAKAANIYDEYFGKFQSELNRDLERMGDSITCIEIPEDIMSVTTATSSDQIISAFGTFDAFKKIVEKVVLNSGVYAGFKITGGKVPVIISATKDEATTTYTLNLQWVYNNLENKLILSSTDGITISCTESTQDNFLGWRIDDLSTYIGSIRDRSEYRNAQIVGTILREKVDLWKAYFATNSLVYLKTRAVKGYCLAQEGPLVRNWPNEDDVWGFNVTDTTIHRTQQYFFGFGDKADDPTVYNVYLRVHKPNILEISGIKYTDPDMKVQEIIQTNFTEVEWSTRTPDPGIVIFKEFWKEKDCTAIAYRNAQHDYYDTFLVLGVSDSTGKVYSFQIGLSANSGTTRIVITPRRLDIEGFTVNGKVLLTNPVLSGADIAATGYSKSTATGADLVLAPTDTINSAFGKLEKKLDDTVADDDSRLDKLETLPGTIVTKPYTVSYAADKQKITLATEKAVKNASGSWDTPVADTLEVDTPYVPTANIVDNLTTADAAKVLSANQGKELQDTKINKADIVNDLTTGGATKVLSAQQGVELKTIIDNLIGFEVKVVSSLPATGALGIIYLVASSEGSGNDIYDEFVWVSGSNKYELIGNTRTDLSGYLSKTNTTAYTPTADYHPATKKYSDDQDTATLNTAKAYTDTSWTWHEGN